MLRLAKLFSEHAVLQRRKEIPVWGWTEPDSCIECEIAGNKAYTGSVTGTGRFMMRLPAMEAGGPHILTVRNLKTGEEVRVQDILIGEVWLASGQSNMEFSMNSSPYQREEFNELKRSPQDVENIRMFTVRKNSLGIEQDDCAGSWQPSRKEYISGWSAVGLWFAKKLYDDLKIPVGIIHSSWGGTIVQAWTSKEMLYLNPATENTARIGSADACCYDSWKKAGELFEFPGGVNTNQDKFFRTFCQLDSGNKGFAQGWAAEEFDDSAWKDTRVPGDWLRQNLGGHGSFWIRREVILPDSWQGKELDFHFCIIDKHDVVYFNGVEIGASGKEFEYIGHERRYPVPGKLVKAGKNVIAIRTYSFAYGSGFYGTEKDCRLVRKDKEEKVFISGIWKGCQETLIPTPPALQAEVSRQIPGNPNAFGSLFNGMIRPLIPYAMAGAIWYQGESNAGSIRKSEEYRQEMTNMIRDWRFRWGQKEFTFLMVGLAGYGTLPEYEPEGLWPVLRESQRRAALDLPDVFIASAADCGCPDNIHPGDKKTVGTRLALQALYHTYHRQLVPCGPVPVSGRIEGKKFRVLFDFAEGMASTDGKEIKGFRLAGEDGIYYPADAVVEDCSIVLSSPKVGQPLHVRYGWSGYPVCTLCNKAGLPAFPFAL